MAPTVHEVVLMHSSVLRHKQILFAITTASLLVGCGGEGGEGAAAGFGAFPPPAVIVETVSAQTVPETFEFTGEVVPYRRLEVRSMVDGIILERPFIEGQVVQEGAVLYQLEQLQYEAAHRSALARLENARSTLARLEPLLGQRAVAQQDVDNARAALIDAEAAVDQAEKDLADTTVRAGMTGRVGETLMEVGARVTGPADLLTTIERLDPVYVSFRPSSEQFFAWQQNPQARELVQPGGGLTVEVTLPDGSILAQTGRIDFVAPTVDAATGTREVRAIFQNPDLLLAPGQFVRVRLTGFARENALAVPQRAVQTGMGRQFVYVVGADNVAQPRDVVTGPWSGDRWIILEGLAPGDRVIVDGLQKVFPGQPVQPTDGPLPGAPDASGGAPVAPEPAVQEPSVPLPTPDSVVAPAPGGAQ
jgi:membrane fusion protein (multidrug efflux system)